MAMYDAFSETFSASRKGKKWREIDSILDSIGQVFSSNPNFSLLDIGCGSGRFYDFFRARFPGASYHGVDISSGMISIAKSQYGELFEVGDMTKLDNLDTKFDTVVSIAALHHLSSQEDRLTALSEFSRLLSKDGILVFTVWNLLSERNLAKYGAFCDKNNDFQIKIGAHTRYYHGFTRVEILKLLAVSGFEELNPEEFDTEENLVFVCRK